MGNDSRKIKKRLLFPINAWWVIQETVMITAGIDKIYVPEARLEDDR